MPKGIGTYGKKKGRPKKKKKGKKKQWQLLTGELGLLVIISLSEHLSTEKVLMQFWLNQAVELS